MKATFEILDKPTFLEPINESTIITILKDLNPTTCPYIVLENINGDYLQCMAGDNRYVVESRTYIDDNVFKHFVIGNTDVSKTWHTVNGKVGPITVLGHEVLNFMDVLSLFLFFLSDGCIKPFYHKRNITKMFRTN